MEDSALPLPRKRGAKVPLNTYIRRATQRRLAAVTADGYAVTDVVDAALTAYLDQAGIPPAHDD